MARLFDDGSSQYLDNSNTPASILPVTFACWFNTDADTIIEAIMGIGEASGPYYYVMRVRGDLAGDPLLATHYGPSGAGSAETITGISTNTWHHGCAVFAASNDRRVYLDGGSKDTNSSSPGAVSMDRTAIGTAPDSTPSHYWSGLLAEAGIWNAALTDAEAAVLATGVSPLFVRPQNLVSYCPLVRDENLNVARDIVSGLTFTAHGS